jgi:hypothetical protein
MAIERVGYRRLYDAIDCSIPECSELRVAFSFESQFHVEIYIGPKPRFGVSIEKNDDYYAHTGIHTNKQAPVYYADATQSPYPRRFFTEIICFRDIEVSPALSEAFHRQDKQARIEVLRLAEKEEKEFRRVSDLISGTIGLKFHRQFVMELLNENIIALCGSSFAISIIGTPIELLDNVQMNLRGIEQMRHLAAFRPLGNTEGSWQRNGTILGWLLRAWSERDKVSKFSALFTALEMLLQGVKVKIPEEKLQYAESIRELILASNNERQDELLKFFNSLVKNQAPSIMSRFEELAKQAKLATQEADIAAFRRFKNMRNPLIHQGDDNVELTIPHPKLGDRELSAFEDLVERYINYVLFGDAVVYQSHWRKKPLENRWFRVRLTTNPLEVISLNS